MDFFARDRGFDPVEFIESEFKKRQAKNPRYSLRSFAKAIGVSHSVLSLFFSRKRSISRQSAQRIAEALSLTENERDRLIEAVARRVPRRAEPRTEVQC